MPKIKIFAVPLITVVLLLVFSHGLNSDMQFEHCKQNAATLARECMHQAMATDDIETKIPGGVARDELNGQVFSYAKFLAEQIDIRLLMSHVAWMADDARQGRAAGTAAEDETGRWLARQYQSLGLQPFKPLGLSTYMHTFTVAHGNNRAVRQGENIIGVLSGGSRSDEYVILSAHYDHLGIVDGAIHNGADDDATGVAAILEMARVFAQAKTRPAKSIVFIAFSGEEIGALGSGALCDEAFVRREADKLAVLNLEMLGAVQGKGTYINIWEQNSTLTQPVIATVTAAGRQVNFPVIISKGTDPGSDALRLLGCGVPATTMDVGGGDAFHDHHPHYHSPEDDPHHIDQTGFLKAVQVATIAIWQLANDVAK